GWKPRDSYVGLTVDEVVLKLGAFPVRTRLTRGQSLELMGVLADKGTVKVPADTPGTLNLSCAEPLDDEKDVVAVEIGGRDLTKPRLTEDKLIRVEVPAVSANTPLVVKIKDKETEKVKHTFEATLAPQATWYFTQGVDGKTWRSLTW